MFGLLFVGASYPIPVTNLQQVDATHWVRGRPRRAPPPPPLPGPRARSSRAGPPPLRAPESPPRQRQPSLARLQTGARRVHLGAAGLLGAEGGVPLPDRPDRRRRRGGAVRQGGRQRVALPRLRAQRAAVGGAAAAVAGARGRRAARAGARRGAGRGESRRRRRGGFGAGLSPRRGSGGAVGAAEAAGAPPRAPHRAALLESFPSHSHPHPHPPLPPKIARSASSRCPTWPPRSAPGWARRWTTRGAWGWTWCGSCRATRRRWSTAVGHV
jgi:hypothetical protein